MSESVQQHRESAPDQISCVVITVSDTRTEETDRSGTIMRERLAGAGHRIVGYHIVPDEPEQIDALLDRYTADEECQAILFNGGTGIASRDTTYDVISRRVEKVLPGFGELFRMLSYDEIGGAAMLSRATAGVINGTLILSTPGSSNAVALAMDKLITSEIAHLVFEVNK